MRPLTSHIKIIMSAVATQNIKPKLAKPSQFQVLLLNDDYTTMDFVMEVLENIFFKSYDNAYELMMIIHTQGQGICGIYSFDVAQTKVQQVLDYAKYHEQALMCILKKV